jgi:hypothetical protein
MNAKAIAVVVALGSSAALIACILADPPPIIETHQEAPEIQTLSVSPPTNQVLKTLPPCTNTMDCFVVPVLVDPNAAVKWRVFSDLDPTGSPTQFPIRQDQDDGGVLGVAGDAGAGIRNITFSLNQNLGFDPTQCHTITFIVAYDFFPDDFSKPLPPGFGSTVSWRYEPLDDCTFYDAGVLPDGGMD